MGKMTFQLGWEWSKNVKPIVKTNSCQIHHVGFMISGRLKMVLDEGSEAEFSPGDAYVIHTIPSLFRLDHFLQSLW
jgi:hypothetical protein